MSLPSAGFDNEQIENYVQKFLTPNNLYICIT